MSEIVKRLRDPRHASDRIEFLECRIEAADEIERLTAEVERKDRAFTDLRKSCTAAVKMLCSEDEDTRNEVVPYLRNRIYQAMKDYWEGE